MNPKCPFQYMNAQVSTQALETIQSGRPQSLPPHEYLSFKNPDPYLLAIILKSTVSISTLLANPCAMPCIYKPRNLFQLGSASTSEPVFLGLFAFPLRSFYTCHTVIFLWCRKQLFSWWHFEEKSFSSFGISELSDCQWFQGQMNQTATLF